MASEYAGVLAMVGLALSGIAAAAGLRRVCAPRGGPATDAGSVPDPSPGCQTGGSAQGRFAARFYPVAILSVVFNAALVLLVLWGASFRELGAPGLALLAGFALPLVVGLVYEWAKGALEW